MSDDQPATGESRRFEEMLERYGELLRAAIARACPRRLGLQFDDIEQEARLRLWRVLQTETEIAHPSSYLYRLALSVTVDAVRRVTARREEQLRLSGEQAQDGSATVPEPATNSELSPESLVERRLIVQKVTTALSRLPDDKRRAVGLHLRGFTPPEIAKLLKWSEPKARSLVYRGLQDLRDRLAAEGITYEME